MMNRDISRLPDVKAARELAEYATYHGWLFGFAENVDNGENPFFTVHVAHPDRAPYYKLTWHTRGTGSYRLFSKLVQRQVGGPWQDAPAVKHVREAICRESARA